jgi:hypothetical protein
MVAGCTGGGMIGAGGAGGSAKPTGMAVNSAAITAASPIRTGLVMATIGTRSAQIPAVETGQSHHEEDGVHDQ